MPPVSDLTLGLPLWPSGRSGWGQVVMTAFDYTAAPLKYWDGQSALWQRLLTQSAPPASLLTDPRSTYYPYYAGPRNSGDPLGNIAAQIPQVRLPSLWLIIGYLLAYILVLVPVQYYALKRIDRRGWAWLTTPALVLAFSFGACGLGYGIRGGGGDP